MYPHRVTAPATAESGESMRLQLPSLDALACGLRHCDLAARLIKVLGFAQTGLQRLPQHAPHWEDQTLGLVTQADKVVVETALLALLASRAEDTSVVHAAARLADQLAPLARSERNLILLLRFPHTAASLGIAHIALSRMGRGDEHFQRVLRNAMDSGQVDALERLPYRTMDLDWTRSLLDSPPPAVHEELLRYSILTSAAHPIYMAETDAYAATHALMYLTDFGAAALPRAVCEERVATLVDSCLAWNILTGNLDLLGELLMCSAILRRPWSPYARLAMRLLTQIWDEFGFLPSLALDGRHYRTLSGEAASAYAFLHTYHSTYVGGILCQLLLRFAEHGAQTSSWSREIRVPAQFFASCEQAIRNGLDFCRQRNGECSRPFSVASEAGADPEAALIEPIDSTLRKTLHRLRSYPGPCGRAGAAWDSAASAGVLASQELALVLSDALLIVAARDYNLPVLMGALLDRSTSMLPVTQSLLEAAGFLIRQQLPSGAIGAHFVVAANTASENAIVVTASLTSCLEDVLGYVRRATAS